MRSAAAVLFTGALVLAACGSDDSSGDTAATAATNPVTTEAMAEDEMAEDEMAEDEMAEDEMADSMSEEEMAAASGDVTVIASGRDDLTTLVAAVQAAGLLETLQGAGPFTIFAPTDEAFEAYFGEMGMTIDDAAADPQALAALLQHHVVAAADDSSMVAAMVDNPFVSLAGTELPVTVDGDTLTIGGATIIEADVFATNGVIHVIDTVLVPG